jgi:dGTPase
VTEPFTDSRLRELFESQEDELLAPRATRSRASRGRAQQEKACHLRTCFQRDIDRIIHCESFRRLKHKTQVFLSPTNDHFRTRLTHTLEVVCTARCISRCLRLNEDLTEAIALAHDLGHTPFGHAGEAVLNEISTNGFHHAAQSVRVVTFLEKHGQGLNLTAEVIDGILYHSKGRTGAMAPANDAGTSVTPEAQVVRIADLVAYINHDIDDALRSGVIRPAHLPPEAIRLLGDRHSVRIHTMVKDIVRFSADRDLISMSPEVQEATETLKAFLYAEVYPRPEIDGEVEKSKNLLRHMAHWFREHPEELLRRLPAPFPRDPSPNRLLIDYLAGMTDGFAIRMFKELFVPHFSLGTPLAGVRSPEHAP